VIQHPGGIPRLCSLFKLFRLLGLGHSRGHLSAGNSLAIRLPLLASLLLLLLTLSAAALPLTLRSCRSSLVCHRYSVSFLESSTAASAGADSCYDNERGPHLRRFDDVAIRW